MILKRIKVAVIKTATATSLDSLIFNSNWRRQRLPILCFHGIATEDEHECFPEFFITQEAFRRKLRIIRDLDSTVLPLDEAVERLRNGTLPPRAVAITIDDGFFGAYLKGRPVLEEFGFPATVYMTSHYIHHNRPAFDVMSRYLLWRRDGIELKWRRVFDRPTVITEQSRPAINREIQLYAQSQRLGSYEKDELLSELADRLSIDYEALRRRRLLHLLRPDEMRNWRNVDFELHTHRHRVSADKNVFRQSILRNASELLHITGRRCRHFAYPSGVYLPEHPQWLRELGIESAVTCVTGLASPASDPMLLPRIMDTAHLRLEEIESWISGYAAFWPTRTYPLDFSQLEGSEVLAKSAAKAASA